MRLLGRTSLPRCQAFRESSIQFQKTATKAQQPLVRRGPENPEAVRIDAARCPSSVPKLKTHYQGHKSAVLDCVVLRDENGRVECVTASMDKSMKYWRIDEPDPEQMTADPVISVQTVQEGPIFALQKDTYSQDRAMAVFCGSTKKDVVIWQAPSAAIIERDKVVMGGHSGWVRALALQGRWLFSCGCNELVQWDLAWPRPQRVKTSALFSGDIQCITSTKTRVFAGCSKGSIHVWDMDKQGMLTYVAELANSHLDRVLALATHNGTLYSVGADGAIRAWQMETLQMINEVRDAHGSEKVHCVAVKSTGDLLYTGGSDCQIKSWSLPGLHSCRELHHHKSAVRALSTSERHLLSGDSDGHIALWETALPLCMNDSSA